MRRAMDRYRQCAGDRRSWPGVLKPIVTPGILQGLGEGRPRDGNQTRAGWTPKDLLVRCVCMNWSGRRRLTGRFHEAVRWPRACTPTILRCRIPIRASASKGAKRTFPFSSRRWAGCVHARVVWEGRAEGFV